jgi:transcriptional regulator of acetoin/glycerol metabolism
VLKFVSEPYMQSIHEHLKGRGFIVVLTNAEGHILHVVGDRNMRSVAETVAVVPGGCFLESVQGTTSPGICIEQKIPIQVRMHEHFCRLFHSWCCTAAPIFDQSGNFVGSLDVSNLDPKRHPAYLMDFITMTSRTIGLELSYRMLQSDMRSAYRQFQSRRPEPVIVTDAGPVPPRFGPGPACGSTFGWNAPSSVSGACSAPLQDRDVPPGRTVRPAKPQITAREDGGVRYSFENFVHASLSMKEVVREARRLVLSDMNIFISGESGTGKEVLAQAIHAASPRREGPFVAVNCAGLPSELIQSELFGYVEGAFTGARRKGRAGKFEQAHVGTLFLDEVGDMPLEAQANLLRVLQERYIVRLGCSRQVPVDVRVISATNKDLSVEIDSSRFRRDLYYRLVVVDLEIPPLRERGSDLWMLLEHFSRRLAGLPGNEPLTFSTDVRQVLMEHAWPGNVRELENFVRYVSAKTQDGHVRMEDLPKGIQRSGCEKPSVCVDSSKRRMLMDALHANNYNLSRTAEALGISRSTLYRRMKKNSGEDR